jgi:hypothetical protein
MSSRRAWGLALALSVVIVPVGAIGLIVSVARRRGG